MTITRKKKHRKLHLLGGCPVSPGFNAGDYEMIKTLAEAKYHDFCRRCWRGTAKLEEILKSGGDVEQAAAKRPREEEDGSDSGTSSESSSSSSEAEDGSEDEAEGTKCQFCTRRAAEPYLVCSSRCCIKHTSKCDKTGCPLKGSALCGDAPMTCSGRHRCTNPST